MFIIIIFKLTPFNRSLFSHLKPNILNFILSLYEMLSLGLLSYLENHIINFLLIK